MCKNIICHCERNAVKQSNRKVQVLRLLHWANATFAMTINYFGKFAKLGYSPLEQILDENWFPE